MQIFVQKSWAVYLLKLLAGTAVIYGLLVGLNPLQQASASSLAAPRSTAQIAEARYTLDTADPSRISAVDLRLVGVPTGQTPLPAITVQLGGQSPAYACAPAGELWRCPLPGVAAQSVTSLRVRVGP